MISPRRTILSGLCSLLVLVSLGVVARPVAAAPVGEFLASFDLPELADASIYFPVGVAFDETNLWYSQPANTVRDIFLTTTSGALLRTLGIQRYAGGLAWDGQNLWVATFTDDESELYQISVGPVPRILKVLDIGSIILGNGSCPFLSGLDFDTETNSLWVAPNPCGGVSNRVTVYNIDTEGNLLKMVSFPFIIAGVEKVGNSLYVNQRGISPNVIHQADLDGNIVSSFQLPFANTEDLAFDRVTFAHTCALWVMHFFFTPAPSGIVLDGSLNAFKIECPD